jgi:hypothetical protein
MGLAAPAAIRSDAEVKSRSPLGFVGPHCTLCLHANILITGALDCKQQPRYIGCASRWESRMRTSRSTNGLHYHIRWFPTDRLDWERFREYGDADVRANELRLDGETYAAEEFDDTCRHCRPFAHPTFKGMARSERRL